MYQTTAKCKGSELIKPLLFWLLHPQCCEGYGLGCSLEIAWVYVFICVRN